LRIVFKDDHRVLVASSGPEALALARKQRIDVAVLDILMQGMSGVDVLRELKQIDPAIEVVMLTAYETIETARQALRLEASDYLNKPFDIPTMRKAVQRALDKRRSHLAREHLPSDLAALQREIEDHRLREEMARTKDQIYAGVLHDINAPLTIITGFVQIINASMQASVRETGAGGESGKGGLESYRDEFARMHGVAERCIEISRRYLSFLRKQPGNPIYVGVRQLLVDVRDLLQRHPAMKGNELIIDQSGPEIVAEIDATDLLQILLNLAINALQATERPHRVEIHARLLEQAVAVEAIEDGPSQRFIDRASFQNTPPLAAISVRDDGPGIPPEIMARLFKERFTTKPAHVGTGFGLGIVQRLAAQAGGAVHVRTELGAGSTFTALLRVKA